MEELFQTIKASNVLAFVREIGFYHHISFSISLYLTDTDRPFWFAKEVITYVNIFMKDTIFLINCKYSYLNFILALSNNFMALNSLLCADVPLRNWSLTRHQN